MLITDFTYFNNIFYKCILTNISRMSSDLEIIMMAASILEKSGFRLMCPCYCLRPFRAWALIN